MLIKLDYALTPNAQGEMLEGAGTGSHPIAEHFTPFHLRPPVPVEDDAIAT
jgi:hypothetical protein